jgi:hypothetical protein
MRPALAAGLILGAALILLPGFALAQAAQPASPEQLEALQRVLARPEFQAAEGRGLLDRLFDPLRVVVQAGLRQVARLVYGLLAGGGEGGDLARWLTAVAILVGAAVVVARLSRGGLAPEAVLAEAGPGGPPRAQAELERAAALARAGDLRGALHHRYLAVLRRLDERSLLVFDDALTNTELLPRLAGSPAAAAALRPLVAAFDALWYGQSGCTPEQYARFSALADRAWEAAS